MKPKLYLSKAWLVKRFIDDGKKIEDMAKEAGASTLTIRRALEREGLIRK